MEFVFVPFRKDALNKLVLFVLYVVTSEVYPSLELLEDFERAEALAPPGREAVLQHVTAHERALLDFATRELDGRPAKESLAPVRALLCDEPKP